jgi:TonB family protein
MTDHEKIKQKLEAFVDKELSEQERKLVEAHLQQCSVCRNEVEVITKLHHLTKEAAPKPDADYAEHLAHHVWLKIRKQERARAKVRFFWIPRLAPILAGAATLILVAVIGIKFLSTTQETKKVKRAPSVPPMAGMMKDEREGLIDKLERDKAEAPIFEKKAAGAGARKLGKEELATSQPKKAEKIEKADIDKKLEEVAVTKSTEPLETPESPAYTKKETKALGFATVPSIKTETIAAKKGEERYAGVQIMEEQPEPESTGIESIPTRLATPGVRAEIAEKGKITQYFVVGMEPKPIKIIKPKYPKLAQEKKFEGEAIIKVIVGLDGQVEYTEVLKSSGYGILDTAALEAAKVSKFDPVIEKGRKVRALTTIPFKFKISEN